VVLLLEQGLRVRATTCHPIFASISAAPDSSIQTKIGGTMRQSQVRVRTNKERQLALGYHESAPDALHHRPAPSLRVAPSDCLP
jgi:hypothetical protein